MVHTPEVVITYLIVMYSTYVLSNCANAIDTELNCYKVPYSYWIKFYDPMCISCKKLWPSKVESFLKDECMVWVLI